MNSLETADIFTSNPFCAFKNAGFFYNTRLCWESKQSYDCFYYIIKGTVKLTIEGEDHLLGVDDVFFLSSRDHAWMRSDGDEAISYYFVSFYSNNSFDLKLRTIYRGTDTGSLFQAILMAHRSTVPFSRLQLAQLFLKLVWVLASNTEDGQQARAGSSRLQTVVEYININFDKQITQDQLCRISHYSPAHLRRLFVRAFGVSPQVYIMQKRIEAAKELLQENPGSGVETIALSLGFSSASYFCKQFKQYVGMTPLTYQKKRRI